MLKRWECEEEQLVSSASQRVLLFPGLRQVQEIALLCIPEANKMLKEDGLFFVGSFPTNTSRTPAPLQNIKLESKM